MVGFQATTADESVLVDGSEILEAHWFTCKELQDYDETNGRLGRIDLIDRIMVPGWLAEGATEAAAQISRC